MNNKLLYNVIMLMAERSAIIEREKLKLAAVVPPDDFEEINDCVLMMDWYSDFGLLMLYKFACRFAVERGWTLKDFKDWAKRWQVT